MIDVLVHVVIIVQRCQYTVGYDAGIKESRLV